MPTEKQNGFGKVVAMDGDILVVGAGGEEVSGQEAAGVGYDYRAEVGYLKIVQNAYLTRKEFMVPPPVPARARRASRQVARVGPPGAAEEAARIMRGS
ncbi:MAG TPA: hypothetical protein VGW35_12665 [Methylomirabilota bacterium]|nr:hypothetical protein [Methylomirabilota bacterium]